MKQYNLMFMYHMTGEETALLLQALCIARQHDMAERYGNSERYQRLFDEIVRQHDLQQVAEVIL